MSIAMLILSLLPVAIQGTPLGADIKQYINEGLASVKAVLTSGAVQNTNPITILQALAGVIAVLKAEPNVPQDILDLIGALDRAAQAGILAAQKAQQGEDPSTLQPITPVA